MPAAAVAGSFEQARGGIAYFALGEADWARSNIRDYYSVMPDLADAIASEVLVSPAGIKEAVNACKDIGADELILNPGLDDTQEVVRLAEAVL